MPKIYGIGASIVILGAMFKLLNWPGGGLLLGIGLITEAIIFFLSAFEPQAQEIDWTRVYPELTENHKRPTHTNPQAITAHSFGDALDNLLAKAPIDSALIERLSQGMERLANAATQIANLNDVSEATEKYVLHIEKASGVLENLYKAHESALEALNKLSDVSKDTQHYHQKIQNFTETLDELNITYKKELEATQLRFEAKENVYTNFSESIDRLQEASQETEKFKLALANLNEKISSLSHVYENMLTALRS